MIINENQVQIIKCSSSVSGRLLIPSVKHFLNGLPKGMLVKDEHGKLWKLANRLLIKSVLDIHKIFENESVGYLDHASFRTPQKMKEIRDIISAEEAENIFHYIFNLQGEYDGRLPSNGSILEIIEYPNS